MPQLEPPIIRESVLTAQRSVTMEEEQKETEFRKSWDACRQVPVIQDEQKPKKRLRFMNWFSCTIVGVLVFVLALFSKSSFLMLVTLGSNSSTSIPVQHKPIALLGIGCVLVGPNVLLLLKSVWKFIFKSAAKPSKKTVLWVLSVESVVALGEVLLTVLAMPHFDIVTNVMILNSVSILSAVLQVVAECQAKERKRVIMLSVSSIIFNLLGHILFIFSYLLIEDKSSGEEMSVGLAIFGTICVSLNWWENYSTLFKISFLEEISKDIARTRNVVCILSSLVKVLITAAAIGLRVPFPKWLSLKSVPAEVRILVFSLVAIQIASSAMCRWFVVVACKMHALRRCFVVPMYMASVAVLVVFLTPLATIPQQSNSSSSFCGNWPAQDQISSPISLTSFMAEVKGSLCARQIVAERNVTGLVFQASYALSWWLGLILGTVYIWFLKIQRIERTQDLFLKRMYEGAFLEQSMLLNTRFEIRKKVKEARSKETVTVYLCATMWHETYDEMMKIIISMFRLDNYRPKINKRNDAMFEFHIYFDDAFKDVHTGDVRHVNEYAEILVEVIREVYTIFSEDRPCIFKKKPRLPRQKIISTPYGGRLEYTLPKGNTMMVHLKDKQLIRHKKRWSQIMYLYYLLGWKLNRKYFKMFEQGEDQETLRVKLEKEKENTYILALDGDTDFQPSAVMLLIDRLKLYPEVGAACGRIHPTGTGPMVWYQKFEYAVGHWLQKTAEHVFGCVLCSPGCFSLFRAEALMDDNVMKRYTTRATEASHHVQYDQGEDRWLCTLLLQQGWRVEYSAASDAYTNAPQDFKEFYNQRRRWGPSTMANTIDLLSSGGLTSERNSSISKPYILYQVISMGASILGPATICLMIAGSFTFIANMDPNLALVLATVPPTIYLILCFKLKSDTQIQIAAVMSILYAFLMTGTILSIIGDIVKQQTFMTPSGLFLISMTLMYIITAALHPQEFSLVIYGVLYFLCIPSGYLMLAIYSIVNMNNVTWGTRETGGKAKTAAVSAIKRQVMQVTCCKCPCWSSPDHGPTSENELLESKVPEEQDLNIQVDSEDAGRSRESLTLQSPKSWIEDLQTKSYDFPLYKATLSEDEVEFWKELQKRYLEPIKENKEQQEKIARDLKELRNKVAFVFFICNALWLVATMFLQAIGSAVTLSIPKIYPNGTVSKDKSFSVDPISLMFLLSFALLLFMQFFAMLYHR
ncbi:chitin synthase chs-1-like [Salminus brasiliensis]|uniref:chitin synthase chs-1-like n=1 Tax=Salminus brasiliensis TaxID=930266 RepID=UPI003B837AEC